MFRIVTNLASDGISATVHAELWGCAISSTTADEISHSRTPSELDNVADAVFDGPPGRSRVRVSVPRRRGPRHGIAVGDRVVSRHGWWCWFGKPRRNAKATRPATAGRDDLVQRQFEADDAPN